MKTYQIIFVGLMIALMSITDAFAQNWTRRTRVHDLNSDQRSTLNTVMLQYLSQQNSSGEYIIVKQHGDYDAYIHNYNETFLGWHRQYLEGMERYVMARISQGLRDSLNGLLPYWRPTTRIPDEFFYNAILPGFTAPQDQTPYNKNGTIIYNINNFNGINFNGPYFCNNYNNSGTNSCDFGNNTSSNPRSIPIDKFATDLECFHNTVHGAIGGDMAVSAVSPSATIFWIWHAWVDEVYWSYERCRGSFASLPYSTSFENGTDQYWYLGSSDSVGRAQVTTNNGPHSGSRHLTMDSKFSNHYVTNEAILSLNLSGRSNVVLTFWWKEWSDEYQASDGVYISDGGAYVKVMDLRDGSTTWEQRVLNISQVAAQYGLSLNSTFKIKFQQYDNWWITSDGFAFDDISVSEWDGSCDNFESGLSGWSNNSGDDGNWIRRTGGTPSSNTGPSNASVGSYYFYVESSTNGTGYPSKVATITKSFNSFYNRFSFDYNMNGSAMGSLQLYAVSLTNGAGLVWSSSGNQGDVWRRVTVDIPSFYQQGGFSLRFVATTGSSYTSDIAIDNICYSNSSSGRSRLSLTDNNALQEESIPDQIDLRAYPNPFNASTTIEYTLPETTEVILTVSDITGKEVRRLVNGSAQGAGLHQTVFHAEDLPSGVYFYTLEAQGVRKTDKLMLQR